MYILPIAYCLLPIAMFSMLGRCLLFYLFFLPIYITTLSIPLPLPPGPDVGSGPTAVLEPLKHVTPQKPISSRSDFTETGSAARSRQSM